MATSLSSRVLDVELTPTFSPIHGLLDTPLLSLEEACQKAKADKELASVPIPFHLAKMAAQLKKRSQNLAPNLSEDEVAAIHLYTQETDFYRILNARLRDPSRERLKPFFFYIKLL